MARWQVATVFAATLIAGVARASTHDACTQLISLRLPDTAITQAQWVQEGSFQIPPPAPGVVLHPVRLSAHCRVTGSIKPTADSDIRFELWLPASAWDHRYQQVGNGGLAGTINYADMVTALLRGSATASTDDGHVSRKGFDGRWALGHPEKLIDYGYRAVHLTALAGQAVVQAYYGRAARHTYFTGCSDGGRESLMEAQRFPQDFEGYLVGAPGIDIPNNEVEHLHVWQALRALGPHEQLTPSQLRRLSAKVLERCDGLDGLKDGVLRDPRQCPFKATEAMCNGPPDGSCLTAAQARAVQAIYDGVRDAKTGEQLAPGDFVTYGTEAVTWPGIFLGRATMPSLVSMTSHGIIATLLYGDPRLDPMTLDAAKAARDARRMLAPIINADNPDLQGARRAGRKILQFHGWADPNIPPQYSIRYFEAVQEYLRSDSRDFYRLFLVPGMAHCVGGVGPTSVGGFAPFPLPHDPHHDWISALERWVEEGTAPERIIATEFSPTLSPGSSPADTSDPRIKRARPLCPYPQAAFYKGRGNTDDAASFRCALPER